jgi:hypothetical protein
MKVFEFGNFAKGSYAQDSGLLCVNTPAIESFEDAGGAGVSFAKVVAHETVHILQANSVEQSQQSDYEYTGLSYRWPELAVNALYWDWSIEGAAESLAMYTNSESSLLTYPELVKALEAVKTAAMLCDGVRLYDLEYLTMQDSLAALFDYFGCENDSNRVEIVKLFYALNLLYMNGGSYSSDDFYEHYKLKYGTAMDTHVKLGSNDYQLRGSVAQTLTRLFYRNLARRIAGWQTRVEDIFSLISIFEQEMQRLTWYGQANRATDNDDFFKLYGKLQTSLFTAIGLQIGEGLDAIRAAYEQYASGFIAEEMAISWLSADANRFYSGMSQTRAKDKKVNITKVYDYVVGE